MVDTVRAWQRDAEGWFIEMNAGAQKKYSIDWARFLGQDTLLSAAWVIPAGITKLSQAEVGNVAQIELLAVTPGEYSCSHTMTSTQGTVEPVAFRVFVS